MVVQEPVYKIVLRALSESTENDIIHRGQELVSSALPNTVDQVRQPANRVGVSGCLVF